MIETVASQLQRAVDRLAEIQLGRFTFEEPTSIGDAVGIAGVSRTEIEGVLSGHAAVHTAPRSDCWLCPS